MELLRINDEWVNAKMVTDARHEGSNRDRLGRLAGRN